MFITDLIFGLLSAAYRPHESSVPPVGAYFQGLDEALAEVDRRAEQREHRLVAVVKFLASGLNRLCDAHTKALGELSEFPSAAERQRMDEFISTGQITLVRQADLMFGPQLVDDALKRLHHCPFRFRAGVL